MKKNVILTIIIMSTLFVRGQEFLVSPCMFGLDSAQTDVDRYNVLYETHLKAIEMGVDVDYDGVPSPLNLEIPAEAKPIPLTSYNQFHGLVVNVRNNSKNAYLFRLTRPVDTIVVAKESIDSGDFSNVENLREGNYLLVLKDDSAWVDKRQGYKYGHFRKDIIVVKEGKALNRPVMPYNTSETKPTVMFCPFDEDMKVISGITINRTEDSKFKTYCFDVQNQYNVELCDINITTPESNLTADQAIRIYDCAKVQLDYVNINGTYSRTDYYGYGILMNNVFDSHILNMISKSNWGIFGTNNINTALIESSSINRYDVHCYGRDITLRNCKFDNLYNQFSSIYGTVTFEKCVFNKHTPVLLESSYNAYTPFELVFNSCVFNISSKNNFLVDARYLTDNVNSRSETAIKHLPNITMNKCTINLLEDMNRYYVFRFGNVTYNGSVGYLKNIIFNDLKVMGGEVTLKVANKDFKHDHKINFPMYNKKVGKK